MRILAAAAILMLSAAPAWAQCPFDFEDMVAGMEAAGDVRFETVTEVHGAPALSSIGEMNAAGSIHIRNDVQGQVSEMIVVDGRAWLMADGKWQALPDSMHQQIRQAMQSGLNGGVVVADGLDCTEGPNGMIALALVGTTTSLVVVVDGTVGLPISLSHTAPGLSTQTRYTFGDDIVIEPPM